ncbi:MAG: hypothetical protein ACREIV_01895 [Planctomycetaceae bacterium]
MNAKLQGFLDFLDLLAEGQRRQAEVVTGRHFDAPLGLQPAVAPARVVKFPLTGHQKAHLLRAAPKAKVAPTH